jgi:mono/diheme cytochrome c family protein
VFTVGGKARLPATKPYVEPALNPPADTASAEVVAAGAQHYGKYCAACHGDNGQTRGSTFPNLLVSALLYSQAGFDQVVLKGVRADKGMVSFAKVLDGKGTEALRAYIIARANETKKLMPPPASAPVQQHQ